MSYEYKTVAGPERGKRRKGCRTVTDRVAAAMEDIIRAEAVGGWEYLRTDLVAVEERQGWLSRRQTMHCSVLVFRRRVDAWEEDVPPAPSLRLSRPAGAENAGRAAEPMPAAAMSARAVPVLGRDIGQAVRRAPATPASDAAPRPASPGAAGLFTRHPPERGGQG